MRKFFRKSNERKTFEAGAVTDFDSGVMEIGRIMRFMIETYKSYSFLADAGAAMLAWSIGKGSTDPKQQLDVTIEMLKRSVKLAQAAERKATPPSGAKN